ncbi:diacylglycerol/lipid kinase family protein [Poriferisphaera sp. WC338]|uniref:diacylglycerol/lipid kinase family protein n=1 Tax=Poriferisphaera sp. WC338 TaxID=3425129 RepID=UPI003D818B63
MEVHPDAKHSDPYASDDPRRVVYVFANPFSGSGENRRHVDELESALGERAFDVRVVWDLEQRREVLGSRSLADECRCIVSAGGDGSLGDVVNELAWSGTLAKIPIAMLPMGNENLFAKEYAFSQEGYRLAKAIVRGKSRQIDVGEVNGKLFTLMMSAGLDAAVVHELDAWRKEGGEAAKKRVKRLTYARPIFKVARQYDYPEMEIEVDSQDGSPPQTIRGAHVFVFSLKQYAMGLPIGGEVLDDDGLLDWVVLTKRGLLRLLQYGVSIWRRKHLEREDVIHGRAKHVVIRKLQSRPQDPEPKPDKIDPPATTDASGKPVPVQVDGDVGGQTPIEVRVLEKAMCVLDMTGL